MENKTLSAEDADEALRTQRKVFLALRDHCASSASSALNPDCPFKRKTA
jgi:hypothetical protein